MSEKYDYDLFTIGAGSAGVRASRFSAALGARVAVAENRYYGGTCVNVGCIPKKLFVYASHFSEDFEDAAGYGWTVGERRFDWKTLVANKDNEISRLNGVYERILGGAKVEIFDGTASVLDPHTVKVGEETYTARHILVATGSWPQIPQVPGKEYGISSNEVFYLDELPRRILIVGGGYIAVEFAGIFNGLGSEVTQLYRGPLFLRGFDGGTREFLAEEMLKKGVDLRFNSDIAGIEKTSDGLRVELKEGGYVETDVVLFATGRVPLSRGFGLEEAGVTLRDDGAIVVDDQFRTSVPSILACGDVIGHMQLTPVALEEGMAIAKSLFADTPAKVDYEAIPSAIFSQPPIGTVGLTEEQARDRFGAIDVYESRFRALKHTMTGSEEKTFMKIVVDRASDRVVGCHMCGADSAEIVQGIAIALKCGATKAQFDATVGIHPTAAEEFVTMRDKRPDPQEAKAAE